jgi:hypothetical protein
MLLGHLREVKPIKTFVVCDCEDQSGKGGADWRKHEVLGALTAELSLAVLQIVRFSTNEDELR